MSFPITYREIRELFRDEALQTENARSIIRKSGYKSLLGLTSGGPILSLTNARRVCFNTTSHKLFPGFQAVFAVDDTGQLYGWGAEGSGILFSLPYNYPVHAFLTPFRLDPEKTDVLQVAHNEEASMLLRSDGSVWTSGPPSAGAPDDHAWMISAITSGAVQIDSNWDIPTGAQFVLKDDGTIWGRGNWMPGMGASTNPLAPAYAWSTNINEFQQMPTGKVGTDVEEITVIGKGLAWRLLDGTVKVWKNLAEFPIVLTNTPADIVKLKSGLGHVLALTSEAAGGEIWSSGDSSRGQAGNGDTDNPGYGECRQADGTGYTDVGGIQFGTLAVKDGHLWTWGAGGVKSARGSGAPDATHPVQITNPDISDVTAVHGHSLNYVGLYSTESGCVYVWGDNALAHLGQSYFGAPSSGVPIPLLISEPL